MQKFSLAITVKGDRMILDFRGTAPQFMNRAINTNIASFKAALLHWPAAEHLAGSAAHHGRIVSDRDRDGSKFRYRRRGGNAAVHESLMPLFKACRGVDNQPMNKLNFSLPHRYSAVIASQYDQAATFIYGGLTQHGDVTGNFCGDINGNGQGARSNADGEHSVSPRVRVHVRYGGA